MTSLNNSPVTGTKSQSMHWGFLGCCGVESSLQVFVVEELEIYMCVACNNTELLGWNPSL